MSILILKYSDRAKTESKEKQLLLTHACGRRIMHNYESFVHIKAGDPHFGNAT